MEFKNKCIVIISQQDWGKMFISKHHYAVELAKLGNKVYFLNGPDQRNILKWGEIKITNTEYSNLYEVSHNFFFPYILNFKARRIFNSLVKIHIQKILRKIGSQVDIVWSFDLSNTVPLDYFPSRSIKVYMPVDEIFHRRGVEASRGADIILSVTNEIIEKFKEINIPRFFINHGVAENFINDKIDTTNNKPVQVGLSGNFLRDDIDRETLLLIIEANPEICFNFWGAITVNDSNISVPNDTRSVEFSEKLCSFPNVIAYGPVTPAILSEKLRKVDCFLICYDIKKDNSKGTNYHKIMEYLGTGKVIISNNVTTYQKYPGLMEMVESRSNNEGLPGLFKKVIAHLNEYNKAECQYKRIDFAREHLYNKQLNKIENLLNIYCEKTLKQ